MTVFAKLLLIAFVSLAAAVLLFYLFDSNEAAVDWFGNTVKLGGPIAGFIATMLIMSSIFQKLQKSDSEVRNMVSAARQAELEPLLGRWTVNSDSSGSDRKGRSETKFTAKDGKLGITGGTFYPQNDTSAGAKPIGDWSSDVAVFDGDRLLYMYTLRDRTSETQVWQGVVNARLNYDGEIAKFTGDWEVFGKVHHSGTIQLVKE